MTKRKMGKRIKQIMSAMLAGVVCASLLNLPGMTIEADAEEPAISAPSAETYKEVGDLQQYDKLHFGNNDWYYAGTDGDGLVLVNFYVKNNNFFAAPPTGQRYMEDSSALLNYEDSALDIALSYHINNFSEEQKEMILPVNINLPEINSSPKTGGSRQIERYIYVPNVVWKDDINIEADTIDVGSASKSILLNIGKLKPENVDVYYWLRDGDSRLHNPYISDGNTIKHQVPSLSTYDGRIINAMSVLHHDKTKVAFVSSINEYGFWDNTAMTIRYNGEGQIKSNAVFSKDGVKISNPTYGEYLVVQWKEGNEDKVVRKKIDFNTTFISASELGLLSGLTADCKVWVEHNDANAGLVYAKKATYVNSNKVSFDMGVFSGKASIKDQILFEGDKVVKNRSYSVGNCYPIDDPKWRFDGWFTDSSYNTPYDFDSPVNSDITIYSKWTKVNRVKASFYYENAGHNMYNYYPDVYNWVLEDKQILSRPQDPQEEGYTFAGWFTDDSFNEEFDFDTPITADTEICAKMDRIPGKYFLGFADSTNFIYNELLFNEGDKCVEPDMSQFVVPGYTFEGWYIWGKDTKFDFNTPITDDIWLEARWTPDENPGGDPDPNPNPGPGGDPDPNPNPGPDGDPDPNPNPGPGGNPNPNPNPGPGGNPNPNPNPGPDGNPNPNPNPGPGGDPNPNPNPGPDGDPDVPSAPDYLDKLYGSLNNLKKSGFTGTYIWTEGTSLPFEIIKMMRDADFTLEFRYSYEGVDYVVKINKYNAPKEDLDWYGPCYLAGLNSKVGTLSGNVYTVAEGESLSSIAARFNTTVEDIMAKNPEITDADYIYVGQKINL